MLFRYTWILPLTRVRNSFEATNDDIKAFPVGMQMISGSAMTRTAPPTDGQLQLDPSQGEIQPVQCTCPRTSFDPPSWPPNSDGSVAGQQDPNNKGSGTGFPFAECDGYASPLRMDIHFPSCYNPAAGLTNYKENMQFPTNVADGKQDCPSGWVHTPHIFFEVYWNTPKFVDRWTPNQGHQPFVLADGDVTGYSSHGDFMAAWEESTLQTIIDTCNAGDAGMDKCPQIPGGLADQSKSCNIKSPVDEQIYGVLEKLPGNNPLEGWGAGGVGGNSSSSSSGSSSAAGSSSSPPSSSSPSAYASAGAASAATSAHASSSVAVDDQRLASSAPAAASSPSGSPASFSSVVAVPTTMVSVAAPQPTDGAGVEGASTVWETVWDTKTIYATETIYERGAATTGAASKRAEEQRLHDHVLRHRSRPYRV